MKNSLLVRQLRQLAKADDGQTLVLTAVAMVVLLLMAGLAVDVGVARYQQQRMQNAADAAALGGTAARAIYGSDATSQIVTAGKADAKANGFEDGVNQASVNIYPSGYTTTDPFFGDPNYVEAIISQPLQTTFMRLAGSISMSNFNSIAISARAVGGLKSASGCVYVLDPTSYNGSFTASGGSNFKTQCGIYVNSTSSSALVASGGAQVTAPSSSIIGVVGKANISGGSVVTPTPTTGISKVKDPLAYLKAPTYSCPTAPPTYDMNSCTYSAKSGLKCSKHPTGASLQINSGTYCGGITLSGGSSSSQYPAQFASGTYILAGGGLTSSSSSNSIAGTNVVFYNTVDNSGNASAGKITVSGGGDAAFFAPTNGSYLGVLFFQDPRNTQPATISGGSNTALVGALYFPTALLTYTGGSTSANPYYTVIVVYHLIVSGASYLNNNYSANHDNLSPIRLPSLVE